MSHFETSHAAQYVRCRAVSVRGHSKKAGVSVKTWIWIQANKYTTLI